MWARLAADLARDHYRHRRNGFGVEPHLFGIHMGVWIALYAILEERGLLGYLQDEFRDRPALVKYAIVGCSGMPGVCRG